MAEDLIHTSLDPLRSTEVSLSIIEQDKHPCSYLPDRIARHEFLFCRNLTSAQYQQYMDQNFRRSGRLIYRPVCSGCRECTPLRVSVHTFRPSRSQKRAVKKNHDIALKIGRPEFTNEKWKLYQRYQSMQHDGSMIDDCSSFREFIFESPID